MGRSYSMSEVCQELGKNHVVLGQIQAALDLYRPEPPQGYSRAYICFLSKCVSLRTFGVVLGDIQDLFRKEVKLLRLLNLHTHSTSPTWYLDSCTLDRPHPNRLLLTGCDIGFPVQEGAVQAGLDFGSHEPELFDSKQMGENLEQVLELYRRQVQKVRRRVEEERPVIRAALSWSTRAFQL